MEADPVALSCGTPALAVPVLPYLFVNKLNPKAGAKCRGKYANHEWI